MITNERFNSFRKRKIQKPKRKEVPFWLQYFNSFAGIASLILAIILAFQTTTIKDMDTLLRKQDVLITGQQRQISQYQAQVKELTEIDSVLLFDSKQMSSEIMAINNQTDYVKLSTAPQLNYMDVALDSISPTQSRLSVIVKNFGGRPMEDLVAQTFLFLQNSESYIPVFLKRAIPDTRTTLKPGDQKKMGLIIEGIKEITDLYKSEGYLVAKFQYYDDVLKKRIEPRPLMFKFFRNEAHGQTYRELNMDESNDILSKVHL
jgi:hypothetical protein